MRSVTISLIENLCLRDKLETIMVVYMFATEIKFFFHFFLLQLSLLLYLWTNSREAKVKLLIIMKMIGKILKNL